MDLKYRYQVIREIFETAAEKKKLLTSRALPVLVDWALNFEDGKFDSPPIFTGITINKWEYDYLVNIFINCDWRFLQAAVPPLEEPFQYWDFDAPSYREADKRAMEREIYAAKRYERRYMVDTLAQKIRNGLTVEKENKDMGFNTGALGGQLAGGGVPGIAAGYVGVNPQQAQMGALQGIQNQYNQALANTQYIYQNEAAEAIQKASIEARYAQQQAMIYQELGRFKNTREVKIPDSTAVETDPLATTSRAILI